MLPAMNALTVILAGYGFVLGAALGSYLGAAAWRIPAREPIWRGRSHCTSCQAQIHSRDNIPLLSWLLLRGRCRACQAPISSRYFRFELATALLFAALLPLAPTLWLPLAAIVAVVLVPVAVSLAQLRRRGAETDANRS